MNNSLRKITVVFVVILLMPVIFIAYELNNLGKNEKIISDIYTNQLDAILFSVNQYADDVTGSWANKIDLALLKLPSRFADTSFVVADINSINSIYFSGAAVSPRLIQVADDDGDPVAMKRALQGLERKHQPRIEKLRSYLSAGFRKMEPFDTTLAERFIPVMFILDKEVKHYDVAVMVFDIPNFIQNTLGPKMQSVAQDKFDISVFKDGEKNPVYSTRSVAAPNDTSSYQTEAGFSKKLWLLPGYRLSISLKDASVNDLVRSRTRTALVILVFLLLSLLAGLIFLYRNIRAQIQLSQAKTEFVSNVSHEIRTPLALISMYAETLEMGRVSEEKKKEYYAIISNETSRLSGIVNRILNFSKMDANKKEFNLRMEDVNEVCEKVIKSFSHHLEQNGFACEFKPDDEVPLVEFDHESISEAVINLLDNAIKYSEKVKRIEVSTGVENNMVYIQVKDHGIGIPRAYQKDIFDQFYRAPMGNVHNTKGSGLGLSLVKKTMIAHKGTVTVQSSLDTGSSFRLNFPIIPTVQ